MTRAIAGAVLVGVALAGAGLVVQAQSRPAPDARLSGGNVTMKYAVVNQDGASTQRGNWVMLVKSRG